MHTITISLGLAITVLVTGYIYWHQRKKKAPVNG
jgi:hypothetical protein